MLPDYKIEKAQKNIVFFYLSGTVTSSKAHFATVSQAYHTSEPSLLTRDTYMHSMFLHCYKHNIQTAHLLQSPALLSFGKCTVTLL